MKQTASIARLFALAIVTNAMMISSARFTASQHPPVYLMGVGLNTLLELDLRGPHRVTNTLFRSSSLGPFSAVMDVDNKNILLSMGGGLFRLDPQTRQRTMIFGAVNINCYHTEVDQDGWYVCEAQLAGSAHLLKISPNRTVTTLLAFARPGRPYGAITRDGDTGDMLVANYETGREHILSIDAQMGTTSTWSTGFAPATQMSFNPRTGGVETVLGHDYLELIRGSSTSHSLARVIKSSTSVSLDASRLDLATDANPRCLCILDTGRSTFPTRTPMLVIDRSTFAVTSLPVSEAKIFSRSLDFYRGRNTQSIRTGAVSWDVRLSAPAHAGKPYVAVFSLSGMRPGLLLSDGRQVNLALDAVSLASLTGGLGSAVDLGPGTLDQDGAAVIRIDLAPFGQLNRVVHLAWAVLDPNAPLGIAYLPDTYPLKL